jgi:hypothetical protein
MRRILILDKLVQGESKSFVFDRNIDQWYEPDKRMGRT